MPRTPKDKTPANNAEPDVAAGTERPNAFAEMDAAGVDLTTENEDPTAAEIRTFKSGGLPSIANIADDGPRIGHLADVAFFSGLFPGETPATLAVRILAGQSLGLDAAQALFDLETGPGPTIRYRPAGRTFEQANDDIEAAKAANRAALERHATPEPASPSTTTPKPTLTAVPDPPAPNVVIYMPDEPSQKNDDSANNGPTTKNDAISPAEDDQTPGRPDDASPLPGSGGSAGSETLKSALSTADVAGTVSDASPDVVAAWRSGLVEMCAELGINADEKTKTFDTAKLPDKRKMFDDARRYYFAKIDKLRDYVLARLTEDGKTSTDAQKGFFLYAEVPLDPTAWTLANAGKAEAAINDFLRSKK